MPFLPYPQGSCFQSVEDNAAGVEQGLNLQIRLSEHTERPADLDKLKPYVIEHILVLLVAPATGRCSANGGCRGLGDSFLGVEVG